MSDSTEDLKNIDSYGVWVKRPPKDDNGITEETAAEPAVNAEEVSIEEPVIPEDLSFDTLTDNDSTLSDEEVSDIKSDVSETEAEIPAAGADDFFKDELPDFGSPEQNSEDSGDSGESEISLDDFIGADGFEDPNKAFEPKEEKPAAKEETSDAPAFEDGELSLDDFMDGDFSDAGSGAPSSGNSGSDEISLDDFFDDSSSSTKEDDIANDEPLDIDLSFTENPDDKVPTEETDISADDENSSDFADDDMFDNISSEQSDGSETKAAEPSAAGLDSATEEVSLDDFGIDENSDDATAVAAGANVNSQADSEEVDLSDFGIDSDAGETPVKQDVHASKKKAVDYDIAITEDDSAAEAPKVEEVKTPDQTEKPAEETNGSAKVDSSMFDMIMKELSGLKNEINSLRDEFQNLKENSAEIQPEPEKTETSAPDFAEADETETPAQELSEPEIPAEPETDEKESSGFFDAADSDETIALSGDELSNIMNTADITESAEEPSEDGVALPDEDLENAQETETEAEKTEMADETEPEAAAPAEAEEIPAEENAAEIPEENEPSAEPADDFSEDAPFGTIDEAETVAEEPNSGLSMNSDDEKLEDPDLDEINMKNMEEEISIPKVDEVADESEKPLDDILVESSNSDLINSVDETEAAAPEMPEAPAEPEEIPEAEESPSEEANKIYEDLIAEEPKVSESISEENIDYLNEDEQNDESKEEIEEIEPAEAIPEPEEEEEEEPEVAPENEEPELAETVEPEETAVPEEDIPPAETETAEAPAPDSKQLPDDLKNDVKSVLLYMDQLLENLPEDKIMEFAKSEQFTTYKKLFTELGLAK